MLNKAKVILFKRIYRKFDFVNQFQFDRISRWAGVVGMFVPVISMMLNGYTFITISYCFFLVVVLLSLLKIELGKFIYIWSIFIGSPIKTKLYMNHTSFLDIKDQQVMLECLEWLNATINPNHFMFRRNGVIIFLFKKDAMHFKLVWGGNPSIYLKK